MPKGDLLKAWSWAVKQKRISKHSRKFKEEEWRTCLFIKGKKVTKRRIDEDGNRCEAFYTIQEPTGIEVSATENPRLYHRL